MKILMISADPKVLVMGSDVQKRTEEYRALVDDLRVLVVARPWNVLGFLRGYRDGARILKMWGGNDVVITSQDPTERWLVAWLLAWRFYMPLELQIHTDLFSPFFWRESLKNKIRVVLARFLLPRATVIRVVSERIKQSLIRRWNFSEAQIIVLPIFVGKEEKSTFKRPLKNAIPFTYLMVSRLTKEKNISLALRAFREVVKTHPRARLVIVGDGPERKSIESSIKHHELGAHVILQGWQNNLEPYWREADCYLLTSHYEGYGRTVVDALSHGVPVVMTNVGVAGEIVRNAENGFVVPVGDEQALVKAMQKATHYQWQFYPPLLISKEEYVKCMKKNWEYALQRFHMPRLVYILPEYHPDIGTHFYYLGGFIKKISERMRVSVIEEKRHRFTLLGKLTWLRLRGFQDFYVHYSFYGALACIMATKLFGGRVFYWNCGMPWLYEKERDWFEERVFRFILRNVILVTGTPGMAEQYRAHYQLKKDRIRVMPNWIDLSLYRNLPSREGARRELGLPLDKKIVLFVHRLSKRKGAHRIAAIVEALQDIQNIFFVIVGKGPEQQAQSSKLKAQNLGNIVLFLGNMPARRVPFFMRAADVFFMPSDEEGFPHVLLEAMAAGTPFAASNVGGVEEIIPPAMKRFLCQSDDIICFADAITYFLSTPDNIVEKLPTFVERYDIAKVAEQFILLYK